MRQVKCQAIIEHLTSPGVWKMIFRKPYVTAFVIISMLLLLAKENISSTGHS